MLTIGKAIAGGIPTAAYGLSEELAQRVSGHPDLDLIDVGGIGGTLAGNALSVAATRATLEHVLTDEAFAAMIALADQLADGIEATIERYQLPGSGLARNTASPAPRPATAVNQMLPATPSSRITCTLRLSIAGCC
jgi:glutamate-1-semialdehyde 2,1-aminomutase